MQEIQNTIEPIEDTNEPLTKKKPRSQKQIDAFKVAMEKRANNIASRKNDKLIVASEILVKNAKIPVIEPPVETPKPKYKKVIQHESESSDEEIIIVKSKPKKKKVKKIIIEESSDSESDSGSDGGQAPAPQQQSYVQREYSRPTFNSYDYFI